MATVAASSLMSLPPELRYQILRNTNLVATVSTYPWADGFIISKGRERECCISHFRNHPFSFPSALFAVSHQLYLEAYEVFLSENRFILYGDPLQKLSFLRSLPPVMLQHIRTLDLFFSATDIQCLIDAAGFTSESWEQLVAFIVQNLNVPNLALSINAGITYQTYMEDGFSASEFDDCVKAYRMIAKALPQLHNLRRFHVYFACCYNMETEVEKEVMGDDYDSTKSGKVPHTLRDYKFPHRWPEAGEKDKRRMWLTRPNDMGEHNDEDSETDDESGEEGDEEEVSGSE